MIPRTMTWSWSMLFLMAGAFFVSYQDVRPFEILFTYSDFFFLLGGFFLLLEHGVNLRPLGSFSPLWYLSIGLLLGALLLSSIFNGVVDRYPVVAGQYAFAYLFLAAVLVTRDPGRWRALAFAFLAGIIVLEIITFILFAINDGDYQALTKAFGARFFTGARRLGSFVGNPNYHAALVACTLPFLYYFAARRWLPLWLALASLGLLIVTLVYTASNTGLVAAVLVTGIFIVAGRIRIRPAVVAAGALAVVAFIASGAPLPRAFEARVAPALASGNLEEAGTFIGRVDLIEEAWDIADGTMLLGLGADRYREVSRDGIPVHNSFLLLWTEGGFPALIGWLGIIGVLGVCGLVALRHRPLEAALTLGVLAVFCIFSIASPHMYARIWMVPVLLAVGACFVGPVARPAPSE